METVAQGVKDKPLLQAVGNATNKVKKHLVTGAMGFGMALSANNLTTLPNNGISTILKIGAS